MITPRLRVDHDRDDATRHQPCTLQVDVDHGVPRLLGELVGEAVRADAGVVEEHIDPTEGLQPRIDGLADRGVVTHVARAGQAAHATLAARRGQRGEIVGAAERVAGIGQALRHVEGHDVHAFRGERQRGGTALAVRGAGHERDATLQLVAHGASFAYGFR